MSKRSSFNDVAIDVEGNALSGIEVSVFNSGGSTLQTIYTTKTGSTTKANPFTTSTNGVVEFWIEPGSYDVEFHDPTLPQRVDDRTIGWEAVSGDTTGGIDDAQLETISNKITADGLVTALAGILGVSQSGTTLRSSATVATEQSISSGSWSDLGTVGPSVTLNCVAGLALCFVSVEMLETSGLFVWLGIYESTDHPISGAAENGEAVTIFGANIKDSLGATDVNNSYTTLPYFGFYAFPVTAGSRTFTLKYAGAGAPSSTFKNRKLWVLNLGF